MHKLPAQLEFLKNSIVDVLRKGSFFSFNLTLQHCRKKVECKVTNLCHSNMFLDQINFGLMLHSALQRKQNERNSLARKFDSIYYKMCCEIDILRHLKWKLDNTLGVSSWCSQFLRFFNNHKKEIMLLTSNSRMKKLYD